MTTRRTCIILARWIGALLALILALLLGATWLINHGPVQVRIRDAVAARTAGILTFRHLDLSLLPRPHLTLQDPVLTVPGKINGGASSAGVYPEIFPLLSGDVLIAEVRLTDPQISFTLSEERAPGPESGQSAFQETRAEIESVMTDLRGIAPGFVGRVRNGRVAVSGETGRNAWTVNAINGTVGLLDKGFRVQATAETPGWGRLSAQGALLVGKNSLAVKDMTVSGGRSSVSGLSGRFGWRVTPWLSITSGSAVLTLEDIFDRRKELDGLRSLLKEVTTLKGRISLSTMNFRGRLLYPKQWQVDLKGAVDGMVFASSQVPRPVTVSRAGFEASTGAVRFDDVQLAFLDSWITANGTLKGWTDGIRSLDLSLRGDIGRDAAAWTVRTFGLPDPYRVRTPVSLTGVLISWARGGSISLSGKAGFRTGTTVALDLNAGPGRLHIKRLAVEREKEHALLSMDSGGREFGLSFQGSISQETLDRIFEKTPVSIGWLKGDARVRVDLDRPGQSSAQGALTGGGLFVEPKQGHPLLVREIALRAANRTLTVQKSLLLWGDTPLATTGKISASNAGFRIDLDVNAGSVSLARIIDAFSPPPPEEEQEAGPLPVQGTVRVTANDLALGSFVFAPTKADVFLDRNSVRVNVLEARLCSIAISGHIQPLGRDLLLDLQPVALEQQMEPLIDCLTTNKRITGTYSLIGSFHAKGKASEIVRSLDGSVLFSAKNGKFYTYPLLARILAFLNVTELLRGRLPDMGRDGFAYDSVKLKGTMKRGKLTLTETVVEGATLNMAAEGEIDFTNNTLNVTVLVAPFKTIEFILSKIPLVRNLLANRLITVPVRLTGDLNNPDITALDPTAIGQNLLGIMRGILSLPFKVLDPLLHPGE